MVILGLTGGIATGKSTVSEMLRNHGMHVVDADFIAKRVVEPGQPTYTKLRHEFGDEFFHSGNGTLDRKKIAEVIFRDTKMRQKLNSILHPAIRWEVIWQVFKYLLFGSHYIVLDIPLLIESGYHRFLGTVIVVWCDEEKQLNRLINRDLLTKNEATSRIAAQFPIDKKMKLATHLIENNGTKEDLQKRVDSVVREFESRWPAVSARAAIYCILAGCSLILLKLSFALLQFFRSL